MTREILCLPASLHYIYLELGLTESKNKIFFVNVPHSANSNRKAINSMALKFVKGLNRLNIFTVSFTIFSLNCYWSASLLFMDLWYIVNQHWPNTSNFFIYLFLYLFFCISSSKLFRKRVTKHFVTKPKRLLLRPENPHRSFRSNEFQKPFDCYLCTIF